MREQSRQVNDHRISTDNSSCRAIFFLGVFTLSVKILNNGTRVDEEFLFCDSPIIIDFG